MCHQSLLLPFSPCGAVHMAWLTFALFVGVFKDDSLSTHDTIRTRGDTVWTVLQAGTGYTLIRSLHKKKHSNINEGKMLNYSPVWHLPLGGRSEPTLKVIFSFNSVSFIV